MIFEGTGGALDEVAARADAQQIAEEFQPFVVLGGPALTSAFADELAARQIMCIGARRASRRVLRRARPVRVGPSTARRLQKQGHALEFIEKQLIGKPAVHGGDAVVDQTRAFGLVYLESSAGVAASWPSGTPPRCRRWARRSSR